MESKRKQTKANESCENLNIMNHKGTRKMTKHFMGKVQSMTRQNLDMAVITNAKGVQVGKIIVRYTDAQFGWNSQTGIIFHGVDSPDQNLNFGKTETGDSYDHTAVYTLLKSIGAKVYNCNGIRFSDNSEKPRVKNCRSADSTSSCEDFRSFKIGNEKFNILWV